ncbi:hypothetical protein E7T06_12875 [Deinococcus sp. Arct2-2]|uniref:hypothetical protein n=1 Tax=Deinococcus sp. Arct2-2 TaxID=2568653 RepID=UPI0010A35E62|nr:hypothetical protein [Deinococcus sp. Arct2-2]THF69268.1 hypothetical protein E7T06_12875 [Deinococcus sp. Arct2-2]
MNRVALHANSLKRLSLLVLSLSSCLLSAQAAAPRAFDSFAGRWAGALEYQDYGADRRVKIPVALSVRVDSGTSATWSFEYDDFGSTVSSVETHRWKAGTYDVTTLGQPGVQRYTSRDFPALIGKGSGKAVLVGNQLENGKQVEIRRTITLNTMTGGRASLTTLTETRAPGGTFAFRNRSSYTRTP